MWQPPKGEVLLRCAQGPSDTELAKAFLASLVTPAAVTLARFSREEIDELYAEMIELPRLDSSLQVALPRLVTPALNALLKAIEDDDVDALERALPSVLATVDTPLERVRLARAVIGLRDAGRVPSAVAALALLDLAQPQAGFFDHLGPGPGCRRGAGRAPHPGRVAGGRLTSASDQAHTFCAAVGPTPLGSRLIGVSLWPDARGVRGGVC